MYDNPPELLGQSAQIISALMQRGGPELVHRVQCGAIPSATVDLLLCRQYWLSVCLESTDERLHLPSREVRFPAC